jgi:quinol-cytochrome oxidoreductase complex cytochrome b subunit/coenzyme F420-reducing hydrogenase delta subunit
MSGAFQRAISRPAAAAHASGGANVRAWRAIERAFDQVFGAAENPWRHLGAIAFFFFWIVATSGIYLYVFFDTSVEGAFRSVERMTNEQWYAGGIMRSLHRYASDAFVVAVALHLLKELVAGRFAGFRWFSWASGVPLLWLTLASGIGGYWLVWDRLAQFVAVATAEWFDVLPLFGEPLIRNFLTPAAVSDRFFTLMIFLHIGIPLALLAGMFIHIQRVNHADVAPARALGWGTFAALLVLSFVRPAVSQDPADLAAAPQAIGFDWFYLAFYPLVYAWSAEAVWILAGTVTLGFMLLPFVARRARAPVARVDLANCNGCARCFADCPYAAIEMHARSGARPGQKMPVIIPSLCASCGICTGACPSSTPFRSNQWLATGIDMPQQPINAVREELERKLPSLRADRRIIAFGCDQGADVRRLEEKGVGALSLLCIGMLPPAFIEYALRHGADGVLVAACLNGDCAYRLGSDWLGQRLAGVREPHLRTSVPRDRIAVVSTGAGEEASLRGALSGFRDRLAAMPKNEPRRSSRDKLARGLAWREKGEHP